MELVHIEECLVTTTKCTFSENISEYVFFDSIHPSEKASQQFIELMWNGTPNITGPYNLKEFF